MPLLPGCLHDQRFVPYNPMNKALPPMVWVCSCKCGFWLNFNPIHAGLVQTYTLHINGTEPERVPDWWEKVMAHTVEPQGDKILPPLAPSRF